MAGLTGWHLLTLIALVMLLFGAQRLPEMARALGQSARILHRELKDTQPPNKPTPRTTSNRTLPDRVVSPTRATCCHENSVPSL